jgi:hypothetical protein
MKSRFQADADFSAEIIDGLIRKEPTIDFQTADEANLRGLKDDKVLLISAQQNRILVSHDRKRCRSISPNLFNKTKVPEFLS